MQDPKRSHARQSVGMRFVVRAVCSAAHHTRRWLRQTKRCGIISNDTARVIVSELVRFSSAITLFGGSANISGVGSYRPNLRGTTIATGGNRRYLATHRRSIVGYSAEVFATRFSSSRPMVARPRYSLDESGSSFRTDSASFNALVDSFPGLEKTLIIFLQ